MARRRNDSAWRKQVIATRGAYCRACGTSSWLQADHLVPRSQGGPSIVENGLVLCESCHRRKTEHRLLVDYHWLDPDQRAWLAISGYVWWDEETGETNGRLRRSYADTTPRRRRTG